MFRRLRPLWIVGMALVVACKTASPEVVAYRTIGSATVTVDVAMSGWGEWVKAHRGTATPVPAAQERQVKAAFETYQQALDVLHAAVVVYKTAKEKGFTADPAAMNHAVDVVNQAIQSLVAMIDGFKKPSNARLEVLPWTPQLSLS
jgi:hypothetical protein